MELNDPLEMSNYLNGWDYYLGHEGRGYSYRFFLEKVLNHLSNKKIRVLEFGGGRSTKHILSKNNVIEYIIIESEEKWANKWKEIFPTCSVLFDRLLYSTAKSLPKKYFDLIFIDGNPFVEKIDAMEKRITCFKISTTLLKDDGYIIYHDADRHPKLLLKTILATRFIRKKVHINEGAPVQTWLIRKN